MSTQNSLGYYSYPAPVGSVVPFAGRFLPPTWLLCDGQTVLQKDYPDLYTAIGDVYSPTPTSGDITVAGNGIDWEIDTPFAFNVPTVGQIIEIAGLYPEETKVVYATLATVIVGVGVINGTFTESIDIGYGSGLYITASFQVPDLVNKAIYGSSTNTNAAIPAGENPSSYRITTANMPNFDVTVTNNNSFNASLGDQAWEAAPQTDNTYGLTNSGVFEYQNTVKNFNATLASKNITYTNPSQTSITPTITATDPAEPLVFANVLITYMIKAQY
jgi:microcystin-dependent protein